MDPFVNVPDEIVQRIGYESTYQDLYHLCRVSKRFKSLCENPEFWKDKIDAEN